MKPAGDASTRTRRSVAAMQHPPTVHACSAHTGRSPCYIRRRRQAQFVVDLPDLVATLADRPEKFIVFSDDLSFEAGDGSYKALKAVLDGSLAAAPATSASACFSVSALGSALASALGSASSAPPGSEGGEALLQDLCNSEGRPAAEELLPLKYSLKSNIACLGVIF